MTAPPDDQILAELCESVPYLLPLGILAGCWLGAVLTFLILVVWQ